mmetsp:Transcript_9577/g.27601  ORF Transcript_9577/g.27601 Transcript_9577/m.27601 type:complete len:87 (-) Transcript_9577:57-317(-)
MDRPMHTPTNSNPTPHRLTHSLPHMEHLYRIRMEQLRPTQQSIAPAIRQPHVARRHITAGGKLAAAEKVPSRPPTMGDTQLQTPTD